MRPSLAKFRKAPRLRRVSETQRHVDLVEQCPVRRAGTTDDDNMSAGLTEAAVRDGFSRVGERREDIGSPIDLLRGVANYGLDAEYLPNFAGKPLAIGTRGAEDLHLFDITDLDERLHVASRHPTRSEQSDDFGILARHVLDADAAVRPDAHVLENPVIQDCERFRVLDRRQQDDPAPATGPHTVFLLGRDSAPIDLGHDVRFHADGEISAPRSAFHRAPLVDLVFIRGWNLDVDAWAAGGF